ncbi:MAG: penicillin acylase family protein [Gaiellaceae bacterium]
MRTAPLLAVLAAALVVGVAASGATGQADHAAIALNVLPPGESGSLAFPPNATDQAALYDGLTPLFDKVTGTNYAQYFKPETLGVSGPVVKTERPRAGVKILRDTWGVPHIYGTTRYNTEYGAGYATAEDRILLMQLLRGPGRVAALDVPGVDPIGLALTGQDFTPTAAANAELAKQIPLLNKTALGRQVGKDVRAYVDGINAWIVANGDFFPHWTPTDVAAIGAIIGAQFGVGGGDEARRSEMLSALEAKLGATKGRAVWNDLRSEQDPEAPVSVDGTFNGHTQPGNEAGNVVLDSGTFTAAAARAQPQMSNALLIAARRSKTGHPLAVMGPQVGYAFPELLMEEDLHGGGIDARGAAFPGISMYVLLGRGSDFAWSATSSDSDIVDQFVETLCGGDDVHYLYKGQCRAMGTFDAGLLHGKGGAPDRELIYHTTVHGPVVGYATVKGTKVAVSSMRSTRGRELLGAIAFEQLNTGAVHDAKSFFKTMGAFELTFNWFYADSKNIAMFSSGRVPIRAPGVNDGLPTKGTGDYEWRGWIPAKDHPQGIDPKNGTIVNWNNKPALGWPAADAKWDFQSHYRVELLKDNLPAGKMAISDVVRAMNMAATQDIRIELLWPTLKEMLQKTSAPNARDAQLVGLLDAWRAAGGSRLDRNGDGKVDDPGAAIMDAAWPKFADAVLSPVLGSLTTLLATLVPRSEDPTGRNGSSYASGWYGYVDKDLRSELGKPVKGAYSTRYCGNGDVTACSTSLWAALDSAANDLAAAQGPDPVAWRADATKERIGFGLLPLTMRWANRPTFQQVISFRSHR